MKMVFGICDMNGVLRFVCDCERGAIPQPFFLNASDKYREGINKACVIIALLRLRYMRALIGPYSLYIDYMSFLVRGVHFDQREYILTSQFVLGSTFCGGVLFGYYTGSLYGYLNWLHALQI